MNIQSCETLTNTFGLDFRKKTYSSCVWWHTPVILAFRRQRQEDFTLRLAEARKPCYISSKTRPRTKDTACGGPGAGPQHHKEPQAGSGTSLLSNPDFTTALWL